MSSRAPHHARVIQLRPATAVAEATRPARTVTPATEPRTDQAHRILRGPQPVPVVKEPLWRHIVGDVLRRERLAQERRLRDVADQARISMPYLSEIERGRKEASSEVLAAAAHALGLSLADLLTLAQAELARLTQPGQPKQAPGADRPSRTIAPAQPAPERDLDPEITVSPEGANAPADQPNTAEASLSPGGVGIAGAGVAGAIGVGVSGEASLVSGGVGIAGAGVAGAVEVSVSGEASLSSGGIGPAGAGVAGADGVGFAGEAELSWGAIEAAGAGVAGETKVTDAGKAELASGEVGSLEVGVADVAGLSSWQVKLSLAA